MFKTKLVISIYLFLFVYLFLLKSSADDTKRKKYKIYGGQNCYVEDYPHMVSIRKTVGLIHMCGGSIVSKKWVLTAGHCVYGLKDKPQYLSVLAGLSDYWRHALQYSVVRKIYVHDKYDPYKFYYHDIAMLRACTADLQKPFYFSPVVSPVQLPISSEHDDKKVCNISIVMGWGEQCRSSQVQNHEVTYRYNTHLQCVSIPIITNDRCHSLLNMYIPSTIICAMYEQGGKDACYGDSGGPLMCGKVLTGIISGGFKCGLPRTPGVYTRVDKFISFINKTITNSQSILTASKMTTLSAIILLYFNFKNY